MATEAEQTRPGVPLKDMPEEAKRIVDHARASGIQLRLMGGLGRQDAVQHAVVLREALF